MKMRKKPSLMDYVGSTGGLYGKTAADVQAYIQTERAAWESVEQRENLAPPSVKSLNDFVEICYIKNSKL